MKTIKNLLLALTVLFASLGYANNNPESEASKVLSKEILSLLDKPKFEFEQDVRAEVIFILNKNNEIVVLSVETDNSNLESYIKRKLNYTKLSKKIKRQSTTYRIPVRLVKK